MTCFYSHRRRRGPAADGQARPGDEGRVYVGDVQPPTHPHVAFQRGWRARFVGAVRLQGRPTPRTPDNRTSNGRRRSLPRRPRLPAGHRLPQPPPPALTRQTPPVIPAKAGNPHPPPAGAPLAVPRIRFFASCDTIAWVFGMGQREFREEAWRVSRKLLRTRQASRTWR